jgi:hypothetical protein
MAHLRLHVVVHGLHLLLLKQPHFQLPTPQWVFITASLCFHTSDMPCCTTACFPAGNNSCLGLERGRPRTISTAPLPDQAGPVLKSSSAHYSSFNTTRCFVAALSNDVMAALLCLQHHTNTRKKSRSLSTLNVKRAFHTPTSNTLACASPESSFHLATLRPTLSGSSSSSPHPSLEYY